MSGDDQTKDQERRRNAARLWLKVGRALESAWALLDERRIGVAAYRDLADDSVALVGFQASAAATILSLRSMAAVIAPGYDGLEPPAGPATEEAPAPATPGVTMPPPPTVREIRLALLAVAGHISGDVSESEISRWPDSRKRQAVAWAFEQARLDNSGGLPTLIGKPGFIP